MQSDINFKTYRYYHNHAATSSNILKITRLKFPQEYISQFSNIQVDEQKWSEICFYSLNQSESFLWHNERFSRITCSSKAHRIKTRQKISKVKPNSLQNKNIMGI